MDEQNKGKKRPKSYYPMQAAGGKRIQHATTCMKPGMKGFLVTCNKYDLETEQEMYDILYEYANKIYGPEEDEQPREFQNMHTEAKNVIFIRSNIDDPCHLVHSMFEDIHENQVKIAKYAQRIIPVSIISDIDSISIETAMKTVLTPLFGTDSGVGVKYTAICKVRNKEAMSGIRLIPLLYKIIEEMNPLHQLCHDEPDWVVIIETMRRVCCLSIVKDFTKFRKFNFHEIVRNVQKDESETVVKADGDEKPETCGNSEAKEGDVKREPGVKLSRNREKRRRRRFNLRTANFARNKKLSDGEDSDSCGKYYWR